jgi:hypothetical protein
MKMKSFPSPSLTLTNMRLFRVQNCDGGFTSASLFLAHDLFGKPVPTFPDHARIYFAPAGRRFKRRPLGEAIPTGAMRRI